MGDMSDCERLGYHFTAGDSTTCSRCGYPAAQPDPKCARTGQPLTMLFVGATEAQKDMMLSAECAASSWRDVFAERDQFRARVQELERIAGGLTNTLHDVGDTHAQAVAERDQLRAEVEALKRDRLALRADVRTQHEWAIRAQRELDEARNNVAITCDQLRARVQELERELSELVLKHGGVNAGHAFGPANCASCGMLTNDYYLIGQAQLCLQCYDSFPALIAERDAARAECRRLEAQAARMREALECIETGHDPSTGEPNASAAIAKQALAETDAGALVQGLVEALQFYGREEQVLGGSDYQQHGTSSYRQSTDDGGKRAREALAAWDAGGKGRDGDGE